MKERGRREKDTRSDILFTYDPPIFVTVTIHMTNSCTHLYVLELQYTLLTVVHICMQ